MSEERFVAIEAKLDAHTRTLDAHTRTLDAHTKTLDAHSQTLDAHTKTLDRLEIGQEEMRDQIAQVAEGHAATQALITRSFVAMHALIDSRVDPYVKAVQHHSAILAAHKLSLPWEDPSD
jgi:predicted aspartyl protease